MVSTRFRALLFAILVLVSGIAAPAAETPTPAASAQVPPPPAVDPQSSAAELLKALPQVPSVVEHDGTVLWQDGEKASYKILEVTADHDSNPVIETPIGRLKVSRKLVADNRLDALDALPQLIERAKAAGLADADLTLRIGILTGLHLFSPQVLVLTDGVMKKAELKAPERSEDKDKLSAAVDRLVADMAHSELDDLGKKTLEDVLRRLPKDDGHEEVDEVAPSLARRVTRCGWLRQFYPKQDADDVAAIEQLVVKAERYQPVTLFEGGQLRLAEVKDAFGRGGWALTTPSRCAYIQQHEEPLYYWAWPEPKPMVVVELTPGSDPTAYQTQPLGARIFVGAEEVASWSRDKSLVVNKELWRKAFPAKDRKGIDHNAVADFMPPHILITSLNGDIVKLITANGVLTPPSNGGAAEAERFLAESAKVLPDPAHLDLIGEYILQYVYDSPDSRFPYLIGNKAVKGDIHQTAAQTIATACGGMFRGDCDDLSELYQTIAERQGRTAHVLSLPQHAAMAFAEKKEDGNWHAYVLQTGPPLEFSDAKLPVALEKLYKSFAEGSSFDPNGLGLLLRFSGENTRGSWRLSWRIFSEPEYAKTMIDVQRDWQYQTYQRGIKAMEKLIADGDQDNANYRELSGLFSFTGQYDKAVQYHQQAIAKTESPDNRLDLTVELVEHLFNAKQGGRAREAALDILEHQLPSLRKNPEFKDKIEATQAQLGIELASTLCHGKAYDLALRTLKDTQLDDMAGKIEQIGQWLASPKFNQRTWENMPQILQLRRQQEMFVAIGVELLQGFQETSPDEIQKSQDLQTVARSVQDWLTHVAFHDVDEPEDVLARYATAGRYYAAVLGMERLQAMLDGVALPKKADYEHTKRIGGLAQLQLDLPWIKLSVPFWGGRLMEQFEKERTTLDKELVARLGKQVADSYAACTKLGLEHPSFNHEAHLCAVITALIGQDANALRERLRFVKAKDDKRLRDDTAQWLGDPARFVPLDWYQQVLQIWKEELNYKPKYYWIAWRAALNGAPKHALMVAKLAAQEFKDDSSFTEEYEFMQKVFESQPAVPTKDHRDVPKAPEPKAIPAASGASR
jgi:hypothetical protein